MAHLALNPRISFTKLVEAVKEYHAKIKEAVDEFEKAEYEGFLDTIADLCIRRGGFVYYEKVRIAAGIRPKTTFYHEKRYKDGVYRAS